MKPSLKEYKITEIKKNFYMELEILTDDFNENLLNLDYRNLSKEDFKKNIDNVIDSLEFSVEALERVKREENLI